MPPWHRPKENPLARKQTPTDAAVTSETDTATTAESTVTPTTEDTTTVTPEPEAAPVAPVKEPKAPKATEDPLERFRSVTPDGITMYNFR